MSRVIARRAAIGLVAILGLTVLMFILVRLLPGGPAEALLGPKATPERVAALKAQLGLDRPVVEQYVTWLTQLFRGDLGTSYQQSRPVTTLLWENIPPTILLVGTATVLSLLIAVPVATYQASRRNSFGDHVVSVLALVAYSTPIFWLGMIVILVFAVQFDWLPASGIVSPGESITNIPSRISHLVLPVAVLTIGLIPTWSRYLRSSIIDTLVQDFVRTARAKGGRRRRALYLHALPNSLITTIALVGTAIPFILSGSLVVEVVFNYPGLGLLFWNAAQVSDYPILMAVVLVLGFASVVGSLLADVLTVLVDPRIRVST